MKKSRSFSQSNQTALETLLKPFREQIEGFQKRVNEIHSESVKGNAGLEAEIKKSAGNWSEYVARGE